MAIQTRVIASDGDEQRGFVTFEVDYDDVTMLLVMLRCINLSSETAYGRAVLVSNTNRDYSRVFPAQATTEQAIPTSPNGRIQVFINPLNNKLDGVEYYFMWPS